MKIFESIRRFWDHMSISYFHNVFFNGFYDFHNGSYDALKCPRNVTSRCSHHIFCMHMFFIFWWIVIFLPFNSRRLIFVNFIRSCLRYFYYQLELQQELQLSRLNCNTYHVSFWKFLCCHLPLMYSEFPSAFADFKYIVYSQFFITFFQNNFAKCEAKHELFKMEPVSIFCRLADVF